MKSHPAAKLFPRLSEGELTALAADIRAHGQQQPILLMEHNGEPHIIDGRNRFAACAEAGVEPVFETVKIEDPYTFVVSINLKRRHLDVGQRAVIGALILSKRPRRKGGPKVTGENSPVSSAREVAKLVEVNKDSVGKALKLTDAAGLTPTTFEYEPEVREAAKAAVIDVQSGDATLQKAVTTVFPTVAKDTPMEDAAEALVRKAIKFGEEYGLSDDDVVEIVAAGLADSKATGEVE